MPIFKLNSFYNKPLAISPERLADFFSDDQIKYFMQNKGVSSDMLNDDEIDTKDSIISYDVNGGIAVLPIHGLIEPKLSFWGWLFGSTPLCFLEPILNDLVARQDIKKIILDIDSPGGSVDGVQSMSKLIYDARSKKDIVAYCNSLAASAAYWIGSAASKFVMSSETAMAGSIGVVCMHHDVSKLEENIGVKTTEIYAGKYKRIDSGYAPLSKEGKDYLQSQVDYIYSIFVQDISRNRDKDIDTVLKDMADGKILIGRQALEYGLADEISTIESILKDDDMLINKTQGARAQDEPKQEDLQKENEQLREENEQLRKENEELKKKLEDSKPAEPAQDETSKALNEERNRIVSIMEINFPGYDGAKAKAIKEGTSVKDFALALVQGKAQKDQGQQTPQSQGQPTVDVKDIARGFLYLESPKVKQQLDTSKLSDAEMEAAINAAVASANKA